MAKKPTYEELEQRVKELEREVSECNRAAEELKQEQSIFTGGPIVVFTWLATENWPVAYVSPNVSQFGYQAEDFVSGKLPYADIIHLEDLDKVLSEVKEFSESGIPFYEQEYRIIRADGETRWVHDFTIVRRNDEGKITNYDGYVLDITSRKQAEKNLREREETLKALLNAPTENAMLVDLEGTILALNQVGVQRLGKSEDELIGKGIFDYLPHDVAESRKAHADKVVRTGKSFRFQDERAGRFYDNNIYPVFDIDGKVRSLAVYSNDITETKRAEDALRESEDRFRKTVKGTRAGYFFIDRDGLFQDVNEAWLKMHGYSSREEVIGKHFSLTQVDDDVEMAQRNVEKLLTGEPIESGEFSRRCKDGSVAHHTFSASPVIRGDEIIGLEGFIIDYSALKHAEEALLESEIQYRETLDAMEDWILVVDPDLRIVMFNAAFMQINKQLGLTTDVIDRTPMEIFPFLRDTLLDEYRWVFENKRVLITQENTKVGSWEFISESRKIPLVKEGRIVRVITIIRDISEQKRLETQLQRIQKMEAIGTLAGGIAHDFNNLLTGIQGNISLMLLNIDPTHPHYEMLNIVIKQVESGARLTSHLLAYARKGKYEIKVVDLNQLVEETSETFGRARKQIQIHRDLAGDLSAIEADAGQIEQVLLNLFVNAADAMSMGGDLFIKTINVFHKDMMGGVHRPKRRKYVMLKVTDSGMGMDKETIERIFDPFFTTKEMGRGTGLGLASTNGIINSHGGYIDVKSKKGEGTTFSIFLPASEKDVERIVRNVERITKTTGTILLVDDESVILEVGRNMLEAIGYSVMMADNGKKAIELYKKNQDEIAIVVLDLLMPAMGGGEVYNRLKEINPYVKVLLSSGYSVDGEASEILKRGCNGFIQKPFGMNGLAEKISEILGQKEG